jgi:hypothetical protein
MGENYTTSFPVEIKGLLGSTNKRVAKAHEQLKQGVFRLTKQLTEEIVQILETWSQGFDVILAHNVLHMPFNLPLTLALRRLASSRDTPAIVTPGMSSVVHIRTSITSPSRRPESAFSVNYWEIMFPGRSFTTGSTLQAFFISTGNP